MYNEEEKKERNNERDWGKISYEGHLEITETIQQMKTKTKMMMMKENGRSGPKIIGKEREKTIDKNIGKKEEEESYRDQTRSERERFVRYFGSLFVQDRI